MVPHRRLVFALLTLAWAPALRAQERPAVSLSVDRAEGASSCPASDAVADAVRSRLGADPFRPDATLHIRVSFARRRRELTAEIRSEGTGASLRPRTLRSRRRDCAALSTSVVLSLVLALDTLVPSAPEPPPPVTPPPPEPPPSPPVVVALVPPPALAPPPPPQPAPPAPPRAVPDRWSARVGLDVMGAVGLSPQVTPGLSLGVSFLRRRYSVGVDVRAFLPTASEPQSFGAVEVLPLLVGVTGCYRLGELSVCALVLAGALLSEGREVVESIADSTPHVRAGARIGWSSRLAGPLRWRVAAEGHAAVTPTTLYIRDRGNPRDAWETPGFAATLALGFEFTP